MSTPSEELRILVVDDADENLFLMRKLISRIGHQVLTARDGAEAVAVFERERPDIVLMDVMMPVMDGYEATARIKALEGGAAVPVIFLTAKSQDSALAAGIEVGGDDYLAKPISFVVLNAKLKAVARTLSLQRQIERNNAELTLYRDSAEEELRVASHLMQRLVRTDALEDPALAHYLAPAARLSGDIIAAARTPAGVLHVLLADGTGHGLAASLNVMPITQPFYAMTEKGFNVGTIAREMNAKTRQWLPRDRFVAATLIAVDFRDGTLHVWNGGIPPVLLLSERGRPVFTFPSRHLPFGVLDDASFDAAMEAFEFRPDMQVFACTDGLLEAANGAGEEYGTERLLAAMAVAARDQRLEALRTSLDAHLAGTSAHDDVSVALIACDERRLPAHAIAAAVSPSVEDSSSGAGQADPVNALETRWHFSLTLGATELRRVDPVPLLLSFIGEIGEAGLPRGELFVVLAELFNNALDHGVLGLDSQLKQGTDGMEKYLTEREARLGSLREGRVEVSVEAILVDGRNGFRIMVRDSGAGFDSGTVCAQAANDEICPHGRGIVLVRSLCESVEFRGAGNEVSVIYCPDGTQRSVRLAA